MNFAHLHLLLNHFPVIGGIVGFCIFFASLFGKNDDLRRSSLIVLIGIALLTIPTFLSGTGAELRITGQPGVSDALIARHEGAAILAFWLMEVTGALAVVGLWEYYRHGGLARWNIIAILVLSLLTVGFMARAGNTGGDIRHSEVGMNPDRPHEGPIGSMLRVVEPSPAKFSHAMVFTKWVTAALMDLHFIGLVLIIGSVGVFNLRILGLGKQMPVAPLHRFLPWAFVGFAINVVTGTLAYLGSPELYTYDVALWLKILALMLLGFNAAVFYLSNMFAQVEVLGPGQDAPLSAKVVAGTSMALWFAVVILGRYIQVAGGTISPPGN